MPHMIERRRKLVGLLTLTASIAITGILACLIGWHYFDGAIYCRHFRSSDRLGHYEDGEPGGNLGCEPQLRYILGTPIGLLGHRAAKRSSKWATFGRGCDWDINDSYSNHAAGPLTFSNVTCVYVKQSLWYRISALLSVLIGVRR